ncbi:MAG: glutathione S-transferase N-terminal domain-containing protein [Lachnospiraceae bacterium]|nr:glutathione S-transferase N-terminal domain-containing protein [Lachnospiraceae bacterium]
MELKLYMFETCPYCRKVLNSIEKSGRTDVELHNIHKSEEDRLTLIEVGGKQQVPCLFIDGKPLYESDDIVDWLEAHPQMK